MTYLLIAACTRLAYTLARLELFLVSSKARGTSVGLIQLNSGHYQRHFHIKYKANFSITCWSCWRWKLTLEREFHSHFSIATVILSEREPAFTNALCPEASTKHQRDTENDDRGTGKRLICSLPATETETTTNCSGDSPEGNFYDAAH